MAVDAMKTEVPEELRAFSFRTQDQRFSLVGTDMVLVMSIVRDFHRYDADMGWAASCGWYVRIEPAKIPEQSNGPVPRLSFSHWMHSGSSEETVNLTGAQHGLALRPPIGEIGPIDFKDRERLLSFLKELRGVKLKYVANLFGFLKKDGSDQEVVFDLPFPACVRQC